MTLRAPTPVKPGGPEQSGGRQPPGHNGHGNGHSNGGGTGWPEEAPPPDRPQRRRSYWPLLLDLGIVLMLFGRFITGRPLIVVGAVILVIALIGWVREARAEYSRLKD